MSEKIDVNNSDKMFVTGVLYGLMFATKVLSGDKFPTSDNIITRLINEQYDATLYKITTMGKLISDHGRVPDLDKVYAEYESANKELKTKLASNIDKMCSILQKGANANENK